MLLGFDLLLGDGYNSALGSQMKRRITQASGNKDKSSVFATLFDWQAWRYGYVRWVICFIILFQFYRHTMDGLLVLYGYLFFIALRAEECLRSGASFVPRLGANESLWNYGLRRAVVNSLLMWRHPRELTRSNSKVVGERHWSCITLGGMLLTMAVLHAYIALVGIFDFLAPELATEFLSWVNTPFQPLLALWAAPRATIDALVAHGYQNRVPIVSHSFIVAALGCLFFLVSYIYFFVTNGGALETVYLEYNANNSKSARLSGRKWMVYVSKHPIMNYSLKVLFASFLLLGVYWFSIKLQFPGERLHLRGLAALIPSYVYRENWGLLTPTWVVGLFGMNLVLVVVIMEPFYKGYLFIYRLFSR